MPFRCPELLEHDLGGGRPGPAAVRLVTDVGSSSLRVPVTEVSFWAASAPVRPGVVVVLMTSPRLFPGRARRAAPRRVRPRSPCLRSASPATSSGPNAIAKLSSALTSLDRTRALDMSNRTASVWYSVGECAAFRPPSTRCRPPSVAPAAGSSVCVTAVEGLAGWFGPARAAMRAYFSPVPRPCARLPQLPEFRVDSDLPLLETGTSSSFPFPVRALSPFPARELHFPPFVRVQSPGSPSFAARSLGVGLRAGAHEAPAR